eukprot:608881-Amorphochlora_amoeboformis.AAC.1
MGFERLTSCLQNVDSNYDTDVFKGIFDAIQKECGCEPYTKKVGADDVSLKDMAYRVVADHIRTLTFAITDGAAPGANGRDYVLRRICRRAVRYGKEKLNAPPLFFNKLVPAVIKDFGEAYPEITKNPKRVQDIILSEEKIFTKTLTKGINEFARRTREMKKGDTIPGDVCANLLTTYGFPFDLTELMAEEKGLKVDEDGFNKAMEKHSEDSKGNTVAGEVQLKLQAEQVSMIEKMDITVTDDAAKYTWKSTGSGPTCNGILKAIYLGKVDFVQEAKEGTRCGLVLDKTNFYAEQGGQIFDIGEIKCGSGMFTVRETIVAAGYVLHVGVVKSGNISVGDKCVCDVDYARRALVAKNHTATHLLNFALRKVLKKEIEQKGSMVQPDRFRFDFGADKGTKMNQIKEVEDIVNAQINEKLPVYRHPVAIKEAKTINGLRAVFAEKYPDPVTVVSVGKDVKEILTTPDDKKWVNYSIEFCGGTHIANTQEIRKFVVVSEESTQAGTRRIVAYTNEAAEKAIAVGEKMEAEAKTLSELKDLKSVSEGILKIDANIRGGDIPLCSRARLQSVSKSMVDKKKKLMKQAGAASKTAALDQAKKLAEEAKNSGAKFVVSVLDAQGKSKVVTKALNEFVKIVQIPVLFLSEVKAGGKMTAIASVPKEKSGNFPAGSWLGEVMKVVGGKGGGRPHYAQGASKDSTKMADAIEAGKAYASGKL